MPSCLLTEEWQLGCFLTENKSCRYMVRCITPILWRDRLPPDEEQQAVERGRCLSWSRFPVTEAISRDESFANLAYAGVCELHFQPEDLNTTVNTLHGAKRRRITLKANAVPRFFKDYPSFLIIIKLEKIDDRGAPVITRSMSVFPDLSYKLINNGMGINCKKVTGITAKSGFIGRVSDIQNLLARLKYLLADRQDMMLAAADLLDTAADNDEDQKDQCIAVAKFTSEQLRLVTTPPNGRRYSSALMTRAAVWDRTSPKLYQDLCNSGIMCLPGRAVLRRLTSALSVQSGLEVGTMGYLKMRYNKLTPREHLVNLALDEVYLAQGVELAAGTVTDETREGNVARTLLCTMINSIAGRYEDMISMDPIESISADRQVDIFLQVLQGLTEVGYQVVSVTTDGHKVNTAFQAKLGVTPDKPWFANPFVENQEQHEACHKRHCSPSQEDIHVDIGHLVSVYNCELGKEAKMAYRLTDKVLNPTNIERTNVLLVAAATHESTTTALVYYADKCSRPTFKETAAFLCLLRKWFNTCNVKSRGLYNWHNEPTRKPVTNIDQESLVFLEQFAEWMHAWQERRDNNKRTKGLFMSAETAKAFRHTSLGLVGLARHILTTYNDIISYILLGKVQSDKIEGRFGYLRKLAGGNPQPSTRQFFEGEAGIRTTSLCKLSGYTIGEVHQGMLEVKETREDIDNTTVVLLVEAVNDYMACGEEGDEDMALLNVLCHIAGYCGKSAAKKRMCPPCTALLVKDDNGGEPRQIQLDEEQERVSLSDAVLVASRQFKEMLNRGKLTKPSDFSLNIVREICFMWRALMCTEETRLLLLQANSSCEVFVRVVTQVFVDDGQLHDTKCEAGHDFVGAVVPSLARALFNTFTSNYVKERNSEIHSSKHGPPLYPVMTRDSKKLAKLQGRKPKLTKPPDFCDAVLVASRQFTEILNRGKLTKPSDFCGAVLVASRQFTEILNRGKLTKPSDFCGAVLVASRQFTEILNRGKLTKPSDCDAVLVASRKFTEILNRGKLTKPSDFCGAVLVASRQFTEILNRGKLTKPSDFCGAVLVASRQFTEILNRGKLTKPSDCDAVLVASRKFTEILNRGKLTKPSDFCGAVLVASRQFTEILNRGKLTKPSDFCLNVVREICFMCTEETRLLLLQANNSCEVFVRVVTQVFVVGVQNFQCPACRRGKTGTKGREE
ncbi:hypothetical protein GWK47_033558 [Chionoecetes opilio]|uniref:Transposable element P transposase-like RNase H domain-containing protein n=1 Tax=Chionoecetes opilio TaxID=41210 RepID=A0A8J4YH38_CHIOP|nr:hypothetical protein GWK47_033558 [Chionoecetes opilio]